MSANDVGTVKPKSSSAYFEWEIPNVYVAKVSVGDYLLSPKLTTSFFKLAEWRLLLYPKGKKGEEDWISLYLYYYGNEKVTVNVTLSILDDKCRKIDEHDLGESVFDITNDESNWGCDQFVKKNSIIDGKNSLLVGDNLKVLCEIIFKPDLVVPNLNSPTDSNSNNVNSAFRLQAFNDFEKLYENEHYSDLTFIIGESKIQAHKAIITSRSPVFDAMFKHDMKEKEENSIEITDISYEVMKEVLRFIYASKVNDIQKLANELLVAAEKYSIEGLKTLCEEALNENLNIENAIEIFKLADMCNATSLKSQVIKFIVNNQQDIAGKPEFELLADLNSKLLCELVRALIAKNSI